jgi:hypothetical protein
MSWHLFASRGGVLLLRYESASSTTLLICSNMISTSDHLPFTNVIGISGRYDACASRCLPRQLNVPRHQPHLLGQHSFGLLTPATYIINQGLTAGTVREEDGKQRERVNVHDSRIILTLSFGQESGACRRTSSRGPCCNCMDPEPAYEEILPDHVNISHNPYIEANEERGQDEREGTKL